MPSFDVIKESPFIESFRINSIKGQFDLQVKDKVQERFTGEIPIDEIGWNVGVIYGASGTGKTTIINELWRSSICRHSFGGFPVIDEMPDDKTTEEITKAFNSVGFATVWSWLKPYKVLSAGEKMRVNLARAMLSNRKFIVFDEFTSVVNREVAKTGSYAIQKAIRREDKQFIAVTCHSDIIDWLEPDWTFCTDTMEFTDTRRCLQRPEIKIAIYRIQDKNEWDIFKRYHYLNTSLNKAADCYIGLFEDKEPCVFYSVLHFPHLKQKNIKRGHRLVVLPDYQGCGIGHRFSTEIAKMYSEQGFIFRAVNSNSLMFASRSRSKNWKLLRKVRSGVGNRYTMHDKTRSFKRTASSGKYTYTFEFVNR